MPGTASPMFPMAMNLNTTGRPGFSPRGTDWMSRSRQGYVVSSAATAGM
ncbi:hypothetical protein BN1708_003690 [Verticillium longisporum]|uniref:Uncharacterized protein n=1 Tax=Verticillium longisporum TaxID=100787 RepID=A0A0G4LN10_VERLO|nr:hypothetical protein BN1708_003690 [Verticillium longisporum]